MTQRQQYKAVAISADTHKALRIYAAERGVSMTKIVDQLLDTFLAQSPVAIDALATSDEGIP